jgi:mannose-6-phosphate isomerase
LRRKNFATDSQNKNNKIIFLPLKLLKQQMEPNKNKVFRLTGKVQHYAWGGSSYIPQLLHIPNDEKKPFAEYWMGAHDNASSEIEISGGQTIKLNEYISSFPKETLGIDAANQFGKLPYLLKILDVKDMLSIQVHPTKSNAKKEFAAENQKNIPLTAPHRNYKDDNHKPELMLALSGFWLLHGFKPADTLKAILERTPELNFLLAIFTTGGYYELYRTVMEMDQEIVNETLQRLLDRIIPAYQNNQLQKTEEDFWAARAALTYNEPGKIDRGIFSIYLFNLLHLQPGEAIFQDAGLPHAYLEGQNVEIMANSDNVLRGGLTPKHVDVNELLKHVKFEQTAPKIIHGKRIKEHIEAYITPAPDFELSKIALGKGESVSIASKSVEIFIVIEGMVDAHENAQNIFTRSQGEAFVSFDGAVFILTAQAPSILYSASIAFPQQ